MLLIFIKKFLIFDAVTLDKYESSKETLESILEKIEQEKHALSFGHFLLKADCFGPIWSV